MCIYQCVCAGILHLHFWVSFWTRLKILEVGNWSGPSWYLTSLSEQLRGWIPGFPSSLLDQRVQFSTSKNFLGLKKIRWLRTWTETLMFAGCWFWSLWARIVETTASWSPRFQSNDAVKSGRNIDVLHSSMKAMSSILHKDNTHTFQVRPKEAAVSPVIWNDIENWTATEEVNTNLQKSSKCNKIRSASKTTHHRNNDYICSTPFRAQRGATK